MTRSIWENNNLISYVLLPFSVLFLVTIKIYKLFKREKSLSIPVICVGNLTLGGAGKTPTVIEIRRQLKKHLKNIFVLTRGYKGLKVGPLIVNENSKAIDVGDESILHSRQGATCVAKKKVDGAKLCEKLMSDLIIMDDGLQSIDVKKDFRILVIDGNYGFGNTKIFPSGPLREPINDCIKKSDVILIIDKKKEYDQLKNISKEKIFFAQKRISWKNINNKDLFAFSAIANNKNFFKSLTDKGFKIKKFKQFSDHYFFKKKEILKILKQAKKMNLSIVCTEKDYVKIPREFQKIIHPIQLDLKINNSRKLVKKILQKLKLKEFKF